MLFRSVISRRYLNLVYVRPGSDKGPKNPLDRSVSLDLPVDDEDGETIADTLTDGIDPADDVLHDLWLTELRETMEAALSSIKAEQAAALRRRWYGVSGASMSQSERKAADRGLMALRKPSIYQLLKGFRA